MLSPRAALAPLLTLALLLPAAPSPASTASPDVARSPGATGTATAKHRPRARADRWTVLEDQVLTRAKPGVLRNDQDKHRLRAKRLSAPLHGTARLSRRGGLVYTPDADHHGRDVFRYRATDTRGSRDTATVTIRTLPVNDAPSFTPGGDQVVSTVDGAQQVAGWATAISAGPANEAAQVVGFDVEVLSGADLFQTAPAVSTDGTLTYAPSLASSGGTALVRVTPVDDGGTSRGGVDTGAPRTFEITVTSPVDVVLTQLGDATEGTPVLLEVVTEGLSGALGYHLDCDGDDVFEIVSAEPQLECLYPDDGSFDPVVRVEDALGTTYDDTTEVVVANVAPVITGLADGSATEQVLSTPFGLGSFTDPGDDGPWDVLVEWGDGTTSGFTSAAGSLGTLAHTWDLDDPDLEYVVTVTVTEAGGAASDSATFVVDLLAVNDPPVVLDKVVDVTLTQLLLGVDLGDAALLAGATDPEGDPLTVTAVTESVANLTATRTVDLTGWTLLATSALLGSGSFPLTYTVSDGHGGTDTGAISLRVDVLP